MPPEQLDTSNVFACLREMPAASPAEPYALPVRSRKQVIAWWHAHSPEGRAWHFRQFARSAIVKAQMIATQWGGRPKDFPSGVFPRQDNLLEEFIQRAILDGRDDAETVKVACSFMNAAEYSARGTIPNAILYMKACGPRVRAAILSDAWTHGKSGSVLALNAPSKTMCLTYFKEANPKHLMNRVELWELAHLPKLVRLFRGAKMRDSLHSTAFALSWTPDYETAKSFATTHGHGDGDGVVLAAKVPRDAIVVWWTESGRETEAIVSPRRLRNIHIAERCESEAAA